MTMLNIEQVENGWILSRREQTEENKWVTVKELILDETEYEGIRSLLMAVNDFFGKNYDKYGSNNLKISFDGLGSKVE